MRGTTTRRLLVIVLCAFGFVALWIVADRSLSTPDAANSARSESSSRSGTRPASSTSRPGVDAPAHPGRPAGHTAATHPIGRTTNTAGREVPSVAGGPDASPVLPAVAGLRVIDNNHDSITVRWNAVHTAGDRTAPGVAYYQATLNGIPSGETAGLQLTINWFNDEMTSHFIRVRAVDTRGHRGRPGQPLIVVRPEAPAATDSPSPTPGPGSRPTATPSPTPTPGRTRSDSPTANPAPPPGLIGRAGPEDPSGDASGQSATPTPRPADPTGDATSDPTADATSGR